MQTTILRNDFFVAIGVNFLFLLLYVLLGQLMYGSLDDYFMSAVLTGAYGSSYDVHLYFINVVLGYLLKPLYWLFPDIGWYFFAELGGSFVSFVIISYLLLKKLKFRYRYEVLFFMLACLTPDFYYMLNFTQCATLYTAAGFLALLCGDIDKKKKLLTVGVVLFVAGFVMRKDAFYMGMPFLLMLLFIRVFIYRSLSKYTIMAVLVCVGVCIGLNNFDKAHYMTSDYKYYADYQPIRALFVDGDFYDREAIYDELEERGLHDLSFAAFSSWMFYDTDLYTLQKIKPLEKVVLHNIYQVNWAKMPIAIMKALSSRFMNTIAWCWVLFSLLLLLYADRKISFYPWLSVILVAMILGYLLMLNRVVYHVETGAWLYAAIGTIPFLSGECLDEKKCKPIIRSILLLLAVIFYAFTYYGQIVGAKTNLFTNPQYGDSYWLDFRKYAQAHVDDVFLLPLFEYQKEATIQNYAYKSIAPGSWANIIPLGFWNVNLPGMNQELQKRGVGNPLKDIVNDNVYVVTENKTSLIERYYSVFYEKKLVADTVQKIGELNILKFKESMPHE